MSEKKGISPLIATVLIIGFTIVLAVLVITWISSTVDDQQDQTDCMVDANNMCLNFIGDLSASATNTSDVDYSVTLTNSGAEDISSATVVWYNDDGSTEGTNDGVTVLAYSNAAATITDGTTGTLLSEVKIYPIMQSDVAGGCEVECSPVEIQIEYS